jgi:putative toxin-antitoxin system antitoxin component (TIGR02293 family)
MAHQLKVKKIRKSGPLAGKSLAEIWESAKLEVVSNAPVKLSTDGLGSWNKRFLAPEIDEFVIPKRTRARRKAENENLTVEETDKALRLARVIAEADRVFGNSDKADQWLRQPNQNFSQQAPLALLKSETGAVVVENLLGQIDHGHFS